MTLPRVLLCTLISLLVIALAAVPQAGMAASDNGQANENGRDENGQPRLVVLDWTTLETLVALGHPPVGAADLEGYTTWVGEMPLPPGVVDIGLRTQPNLELLSQLQPDRFLVPPMFASLSPVLSRIAPVDVLPLYSAEGPLWQRLRQYTHAVARRTAEPQSAGDLIQRVETRLNSIAGALPENVPPLLVLQFMDDRHVRVFGEHSLYSAVIDRLGLETAWRGNTHYWGFSLVGIEALAEPANLVDGDVRLVVVEPVPPGVREQLGREGLWRSLPAVTRNDVVTVPPAWSFGGLPSALRFAELLAAELGP